MTPIEALEKIAEIIDKPPYGDSLPNRYSQIAKLATEALAYKGQDELVVDINQKKVYHLSECDEVMLQQFPTRYFKIKIPSYKAGEDLEQQNKEWKEECDRLAGVAEYWQTKYYELNPPHRNPKIDNL